MDYQKWFCVCSFIGIVSIIVILLQFDEAYDQRMEYLSQKGISVKLSNYTESAVVPLVDEYYEQRKNLELTEMGKILFLNDLPPNVTQKNFKILIWKDGPFLERRHVRYFSDKKHMPFSRCSSSNCKLTYDAKELNSSDAVVFLLHRLKSLSEIPDPHKPRPPGQRWIFLTDESPWHTFISTPTNSWENYAGVFNWSMSYKAESDIPVPYGRTIPKYRISDKGQYSNHSQSYLSIPYFYTKRRDVLVAVMLSNCGSKNARMRYIKELQKHMTVDVYGGCGTELKNACPGHFGNDCSKIDKYLFYLSFENSNCEQYVTEKLYWNAYNKGAVPIIMGPTRNNCKMMLPPGSYIHTKDYARPVDLARHLLLLNDTLDDSFLSFHQWRRYFEISNEHGYFGNPSVHYCRICEALNYNNKHPKVYEESDLAKFLSPQKNCILETELEVYL